MFLQSRFSILRGVKLENYIKDSPTMRVLKDAPEESKYERNLLFATDRINMSNRIEELDEIILDLTNSIGHPYDSESEYNEKLSEFVNELIAEIQTDSCYIFEEMNPPDYAKALARGHANVLRKRFNKLVEGIE